MRAQDGEISRDSTEYAEILAEIFVETLSKSADRALCCENEQEEITASLMECLQFVYLHGPSSIGEIAGGLEITLSAASQLVDRLVRKELTLRRENEVDRRQTSVELTAAGRRLVEDVRRRKSEWFASVLKAMPRAERASLREGLESFLKVALAQDEKVEQACVRCGMEHVPFCVVNKVRSERERAHER